MALDLLATALDLLVAALDLLVAALDLLAAALDLLAAALDLLAAALDLLVVSSWWVFVSGSTVSARELVLPSMMVSSSSSLGKANILRTLGAGMNL